MDKRTGPLLQKITVSESAAAYALPPFQVIEALLRASPDMVYIIDRSHRFVSVGDTTARILEQAPETMLGKTWRDVGLAMETAADIQAAHQRVFDTELTVHGVLVLEPAGSSLAFDYTYSPIYSAEGSIGAVLCIARDVSQRRDVTQSKEAGEIRGRNQVVETEQMASGIVDTLPAHIAILDMDGFIIAANRAWREYAERSGEAPLHRIGVGANYLSICERAIGEGAEEARAVAEGIRTVIKGDLQEFACPEYPCHSSGQRRWFAIRVTRFSGDSPARVVVVHEEITAIKEAEQAVRSSERKAQLIADAIPQIIWTAGRDGVVDWLNQRWQELTGQTVEDAVGFGWSEMMHPDDVPRCIDIWEKAVQQSEFYEMECRFRRGADRSYRWHLSRCLPLRDEQGHIIMWLGTATDVDDLKRLENNIREREARYRFLAEAIPHLVWAAQPDGTIDYVNGRCVKYSGHTVEGLVDWGWKSVIHPDDVSLTLRLYRQAIESGNEFRHEYRIRRFDGQYRWHQGRALPFRDDEGNIRRWYGACTDVDALKQTEAALRASKEQLQAVVSNVPVILFAIDKDGTFALTEGKGLEAVGQLPGALVGRSVFEFEPEYSDLVQHIRRALAGETVQWLAQIDDIVFDAHCTPLPASTGEPAGLIGVAIDVTERMRQEQERQYVMEAAHCLLWYADVYNTDHPDYLHWDIHITDEEAAQRFFPLDLQEGEAYKDAKYRCRLLEDRGECDRLATASIRANQSFTQEFRCRSADGSLCWLREDIQVKTVEPRKRWRVVAVCTDITDRKRLEAQFLQAQKMEGIGRLAGGIAHDFNNLLSVILGYAEMVEMELSDDSDLLLNVHNIQSAATRAAKLTSQLLAFARRQVSAARVIQPNEVIAGMSPILKPLIREDIELMMVLKKDTGSVKADPTQIEQIIINLVVNARDAMPNGGKIIMQTENVMLADHYLREHTTVAAGEYVMIAISDTGVGMTQEVKNRLFKPFFTTKGVGKGTGLGLATVYGVVKQSGGYIFAYSEVGIGTTMRVYLPRVADAASVATRETIEKADVRGTETLLVAEDEGLVRELTVSTLRRNGYTVLEAANGAEALQLAEEYAGEIHLVVSDAIMPVMNGKDLADRLSTERPSTRFMYVSGYTEEVTLAQGILPEGTAFLQKPFTAHGLLNAVREILDTRQSGEMPNVT